MATLRLPTLSPLQAAALKTDVPTNIIAGGRKSGLRVLAVEIALLSRYGALSKNGHKVAVCLPNQDALEDMRKRLFGLLAPFCGRKPTKTRVELINGASLELFSLEDTYPWEQYSLLIVLDAARIDGFTHLWRNTLQALCKGEAWVLSRPQGVTNGFGVLYREAATQEGWRALSLPTEANPKADTAEIAQAKAELDEPAFRQEYLGEVVSETIELSAAQTIIGRNETFVDWCERLAEDGLKIDGHPFRLDNRPTMRWIYGLMPSTIEEAFGKRVVIMKCSQVGFTVMEMLAMLYFALKWMPCKIGMYLPDMKLAGVKSSERFMPIVRTIPDAYALLTDRATGRGEGNVLVRNIGDSRFHFLWTSGKAMTESNPLDVISFDEVQEMTIADMEKTGERLSASRIRFTLMGSTANWPDQDIHWWFKRGTQHQFHTECPSCGTFQILDDHFPDCVRLIEFPDAPSDYRYVCHECGGVIEDAQRGEWRAHAPGAPFVSVHYPQFLSPTISPREILESFRSSTDMKNFYNRKLGKPFLDPSQVPVNMEMLNECATLGVEMGVVWKQRASGTFMGIDQMGAFNVAMIAERLPTGHMAIIHVEEIYADEPFYRCDELMARYGVSVCVVENLPNFNSAWMFAKRHPGKVFIASYAQIQDEMLRWGDAVPSSQLRKTDDEFRVRYNVTLDQYKVMQMAMNRIQRRVTVFPDPQGLMQEILEKGLKQTVAVLHDRVFHHFLHTALIAEKDEEERKYRRRVLKVGAGDPHHSYSYMLLCVAWARAHGTSTFILPEADQPEELAIQIERDMPGLPGSVLGMLDAVHETCGTCSANERGRCQERKVLVRDSDAGCTLYLPKSE